MGALQPGLVHDRAAPGSQARPAPGDTRHRRARLGEILVAMGALSPGDLARALAIQAREEARFGDIVLAHGMVRAPDLYRALARQFFTSVADLAAEPPDMRLVDRVGAEFCIRQGVLPWKRVGGATVVIFSRPDRFDDIAPRLPPELGPIHLAIAPEEDIQTALVAARRRALARRAETRVAAHESCRTWQGRRTWRLPAVLIAACAVLGLAAPYAAFVLLCAWAVLTLTMNSAIKAYATWHHLRRRTVAGPVFRSGRQDPARRLPTVSVMVPLFKEREIAGRLIKRLEAISYPRELLDICLVVEEDDALTQATLAQTELPRWMRQITVPRGAVRTKPRALNFALDFCKGSIIGVYDAEDAPAPDQIHRVVRRFHDRGAEVACLQGVLDFYNARRNWMARCFTVEYATWFRVVLPGLERLGFAIPLGGTTLFFRREALERLGGWDAHNVTEDADLGIRLARHGYRTEMIDTVTEEEANCRLRPWIRQRSRWIKGYAMTYGVHMRNPRRLLAELGPRRFLGVQALFLGMSSQFLLAPVLWSFWALPLGLWHPLEAVLSRTGFIWLGALFLASEVLTVAVGAIAVRGPKHRHLILWVPTAHFYFPLASVAALKGFAEIVTRPFYWDKTSHGHFGG